MMGSPRKPFPTRVIWFSALISMVGLSIMGASIAYLSTGRMPCQFFGSKLCLPPIHLPPKPPPRQRTDEEMASIAVARDVLFRRTARSSKAKVAFMFLTPGPLPLEELWEEFFRGHEGMYSIYVHASKQVFSNSTWRSRVFIGREIPSKKVQWGKIDMVDAERRLLTYALMDNDNEYFVLLSETCIPLHGFDYIYDYFLNTSISFVDCFYDPGPHGNGRYVNWMLPEIRREEFRKGSQWFAVTRRHALLVVADSLYYRKFKSFCKRGEEFHNCYPDEHYVQTFLHIMDPQSISNWSTTHVDWSEGKWHPRHYKEEDVTLFKLRDIQMIDENVHVSSDAKRQETRRPCIWNGTKRPCYLFARKFSAETKTNLLKFFRNYTDTLNGLYNV